MPTEKLEEAVWIARSLFERGKTAGSSANMSFAHGGDIYLTGSGTCFGRLTPADFSRLDADGNLLGGPRPSKEAPLHLLLYKNRPGTGAVIHTHSFHATLWSCLPHGNEADVIPDHTPYLKMRLGTVGLIPFAKPGSEELFAAFGERLAASDGYLLARHGPVVGGKSLLDAFYSLEELEESARIAYALRDRAF